MLTYIYKISLGVITRFLLRDKLRQISYFRFIVKLTPLRPIENFSNFFVEKIDQIAEEILKNGWSLSNYPKIIISDKGKAAIPWEETLKYSRSDSYHIHCWDMLDALLLAYGKSKNVKYLIPSVEIALNWIEKFSVIPTISQFAWYDMAVGLRAYKLAYILDASARVNRFSNDQISRLFDSMILHIEYLSQENFISFKSNHGFFQLAGLIALTNRFIFIKNFYKTRRIALFRFSSILRSQFTSDGVHKEHSPAYHFMVANTFKKILSSGSIFNFFYLSLISKIYLSLQWFENPDGFLINFGDTDSNVKITEKLNSSKYVRFNSNSLKKMVFKNNLSENIIEIFSKSGYFIAKAKIPLDNSIEYQSHLAQINCFYSRTHKHADDLSIIWYDRNQNILIDSGRYGYLGKTNIGSPLWNDGYYYDDPNRIYVESTKAHNTVEIDGKDFLRKGRKFYESAIITSGVQNGIIFCVSQVRHFQTIRHRRILFFNPTKWLIIIDWLWDNVETLHNYKQWFHFAPNFQIKKEPNLYSITNPDTNISITAVSLLQEIHLSNVFFGSNVPFIQGWWSPRERILEPNPTIAFEKNRSRSVIFGTLLTFSQNVKIDSYNCNINYLGNKGDLEWKEDNSRHELKFKFKNNKNLDFDYNAELVVKR